MSRVSQSLLNQRSVASRLKVEMVRSVDLRHVGASRRGVQVPISFLGLHVLLCKSATTLWQWAKKTWRDYAMVANSTRTTRLSSIAVETTWSWRWTWETKRLSTCDPNRGQKHQQQCRDTYAVTTPSAAKHLSAAWRWSDHSPPMVRW